MAGIISFGAYVPRLRLQRKAVVDAHRWFNDSLKVHSKGERAIASWDEDAITMAVEAARDCLTGLNRERVSRVVLASTTLPFADRQNAGIVKEALNLSDIVGSMDIAGGQRAGSTALLDAMYSASGGAGDILCLAAEKRRVQPGSELELTSADAAAGMLVGNNDVVAEFLGGHSVSIDFVDHFRSEGRSFDYGWEGRWVRDEGYGKIASATVIEALRKIGILPNRVDHFVMAAPIKGVNQAVAKACNIRPEAVADPLSLELGHAGAAHTLLLLAHILEAAGPEQTVLLVGFGQGCDVAAFRTTPALGSRTECMGVRRWLARRKPEMNYLRYLHFNGHLALERGMRAEFDQKTPLTALYRQRKAVLGLVGGRCTKTGAVQFPKTDISVAQNHRSIGTQEDYPLADRGASILTHTADNLTYTPDPPAYYGAIEFDGGGRMTIEFVDVDGDDMAVGARIRMMFRIKAIDEFRGFTKYFWKAVPDYSPSAASG